jgi:hypothetical protein
MKPKEKVWIIYDGRAIVDTDIASVYCAYSLEHGETLEQVKRERKEEWPDGWIFEYDVAGDGKTLINERFIE